ncbi:MAG: endonuclease domain-containing protein [Fibrobacterota bacterium]
MSKVSPRLMSVLAARQLRRRQTGSEFLFWESVRKKRFMGLKFLRQHPIPFQENGITRFFIADFYCAERKLVVELDGSVHDLKKDYDGLRDGILNTLGYQTLRLSNHELSNKELVMEKLKYALEEAPSLPPREGGGQGVGL